MPKSAGEVDGTKRGVETESTLSTNYKRRSKNIVNSLTQKHWILINITFPFTTTNLQYNCGMVKIILNQNKTFLIPKKWTPQRFFGQVQNHLGHRKGASIDKENDSNT